MGDAGMNARLSAEACRRLVRLHDQERRLLVAALRSAEDAAAAADRAALACDAAPVVLREAA